MRTATGVQLSIADDGKGFDLAGVRGQSPGLGLVSIDERVRLLCGNVHIDTHARGGTRMRVQIPRPPENPPSHHAPQRATILLSEEP
jgi:signal transduction histidine kinase